MEIYSQKIKNSSIISMVVLPTTEIIEPTNLALKTLSYE